MKITREEFQKTAPLGPVDDSVVKRIAYPHLVGRKTLLEKKLLTLANGTYLLPASAESVWIAKRHEDDLHVKEYLRFEDPAALINVGIGDEALLSLIASRLEEEGLTQNLQLMNLPLDLSNWKISNLPRNGVSVAATNGKALFFSMANRYPTYFDLAVTSRRAGHSYQTISYSGTSNDAWTHSGDKTVKFSQSSVVASANEQGQGNNERNGRNARVISLEFLLHTVSPQVSGRLANTEVVWVSGYSNTPLRRFASDRPTVFVLDEEQKTLYYVPVQLDEASASDNTACAVVVARQDGPGRLHCTPVDGCYGAGDVSRIPEAMLASADVFQNS